MITVIICWENKNRYATGLFGHSLRCLRKLLGARPCNFGHHWPPSQPWQEVLPEQWVAIVPLPDCGCPATFGNIQISFDSTLVHCLLTSMFYTLTTFLPFLMPCVCIPSPWNLRTLLVAPNSFETSGPCWWPQIVLRRSKIHWSFTGS